MNIASLELCRELYELSDWACFNDLEPEHLWWAPTSPGEWHLAFNRSTIGWPWGRKQISYPAYNLGYLLRKIADGSQAEVKVGYGPGAYAELYGIHNQHSADIPEDAACKLAIELFKQGILQHEVAA